MTEVTVTNAPDQHRYEVYADGTLAGFAEYRLQGDTRVDFVHTEVGEEFSGQGLASQLAAAALADVRESGKRAIPHCEYIAGWIRKHPEYDDITDWPEG